MLLPKLYSFKDLNGNNIGKYCSSVFRNVSFAFSEEYWMAKAKAPAQNTSPE